MWWSQIDERVHEAYRSGFSAGIAWGLLVGLIAAAAVWVFAARK